MNKNIKSTRKILIGMLGSSNLTMSEVARVGEILSEQVLYDTKIIFNTGISENLEDKILLTVIISGFRDNNNENPFSVVK